MNDIQFNPQQMEEYAQGLGHFIHQSEKFTESLRHAKEVLEELRHSKEHKYLFELRQMREDFNILVKHLERAGMPGLDMYAEKLERVRPLLDDANWPLAVNPDYLLETPESRQVRARQILDLVVTEHLEGLSFLDYGCGDGLVALEAALRKTKGVVGYDIEQQWEENPLLTTDFSVVSRGAPYDVVLLYDVLDHCQNPVAELAKIRDMLSPRGRIYARNHPWCSKNGGHLYKSVNKAYIHVLFDEVEQMRLFGQSAPFVLKFTNPIGVYRDWFVKSGLHVVQESVSREPQLHPFFSDMDNIHVQERIAQHWKGTDPRKDLTINFATYILEASESHKQII